MIVKRPSKERGHFDHGWLETYHTFSFADYHDAKHMGFRDLRVINEDTIAKAEGFGTHPHRDMEIVTYVTSGALEHKDSMGTGSVILPGDVQKMSAGSGVTHSEFNHSKTESTHLLQIWILPSEKGIQPEYQQKHFEDSQKKNRFCLIASPDGRDDSILLHQDVSIYGTILEEGRELRFPLQKKRHAWVQVVSGHMTLGRETLKSGDGAAVSEEEALDFEALAPSEFLLFDLV